MNTKLLSIAAAAGLLIGATAMVQAQSRGSMSGPGASGASPGHEMQQKGSRNGPGASGYAPGHKIQREGSRNGPGASGFAPGRERSTTGAGGHDHDVDGRMRNDRDDGMMDKD